MQAFIFHVMDILTHYAKQYNRIINGIYNP